MIYKAKKEDAKAVASLAIKMWTDNTLEGLTREFEKIIESENSAVLLMTAGTKPMGYAQCQLRHDYVEGTDSSPVGYLEGIYIAEDYRRQGCARKLLEKCQIWAKEQGCTEFASDCEIDNENSYKFHLKMGFIEANRIICFTKQLYPQKPEDVKDL